MTLKERFADGGLRLGVLDALLGDGTLTTDELAPALDAAAARVRAAEELWYEEDGERQLDLDGGSPDEILAFAVEALGEVEVPEGALATVTQLYFDGGSEIYMHLDTALAERLGLEEWELDTGGETDVFQVGSLEGIGLLTALEVLDLDGHGFNRAERSLAPLAGHATVKKLTLTGSWTEPNALLELPALTHLKSFGGAPLPESVLESLRGRGVDIG